MTRPVNLDLATLADEANRYHDAAHNACRGMLQAAWNAGTALNAAKELCEHGEWLPWLKANFHGSERNAQNYMRIAKNAASADLASSKESIDKVLKSLSKQRRETKDLTGDAFQKKFAKQLAGIQIRLLQLDKMCKRKDFSAHVDRTRRDQRENLQWVGEILDQILKLVNTEQLDMFTGEVT